MKFFKNFLLLIHLALFVWLVWVTISEVNDINAKDVAILLSMYVLIILNFTYIYFSKPSKPEDESWLSLYFERKKLEEKKKIHCLKNEQGQTNQNT